MKNVVIAVLLLLVIPILAAGQTNVQGSINSDVTWDLAGSPYVVTGNVTVEPGATLTISSDVVVRFQQYQALTVLGNMWAHQTLFTSDKDTVGGNPARGDWYGIVVGNWYSNGHIILDSCKIHYGGWQVADVYTISGSAVLNNTEVSASATWGLAVEQPGFVNVNNCSVFSNDWTAGYRSAGSLAFDGANTLTGNTHDAINVAFYSDPADLVLDTLAIPFVFQSDFWVEHDGSLTVPSTDMLKFNNYSHLYVKGALHAEAAPGEHIFFTASTDDNLGGDSNNDGTATVPASGYWGGVVFNNESVDASCIMRRCKVTFGGAGNTGGINMYNAGPTIDECEMANNFYGVMMQDVSNPVFTNNTIGSSDLVPIAMSFTANPVLTNNTLSFSDNGYDAIGLLESSTPANGVLPIRSVTSIPNITYMLLQNLTVPAGHTFTIEKGVVIKAIQDNHFFGFAPRIVVQGKLVANGTPDSLIVFTSARDDIFGNPGDSNKDGTQTSPTVNDWGGITFEGSSDTSSSMSYCHVGYASLPWVYYNTRYIYGGAVTTVNASPNISNCTFKDVTYGVYAFQSSNPKISNTAFINTQYTPIAMSVSANPTITNVMFTNVKWIALGIIGENLGLNGQIFKRDVAGYSNITYILLEDLTINSGTYVTIDPGVVIKCNNAGIFVDGGLQAKGTATGGNIVFTSIKDDNYGHPNDSNGDGNGTSAAPGDWGTIRFQGTSDDAFCLLDSCTIKFGGSGSWGGVTFTDANGTVSHSVISDSYNFGVRCEGGAMPHVDGVEMRNNRRDPIAISLTSDPVLTNITFTSNASKGIRILEGTLSSNATLRKRDVAGIQNIAYIVDQLTITSNAVLTIQPGVVIKFPRDNYCNPNFIAVNGALIADATATEKIIFTSLQDDSNGGDTNNDGNSSAPARGDWWSIVFNNSAAESLNVLRNCEIRYGGSFACQWPDFKAYGELRIYDTHVTVDSCIVQQSSTAGIGVYGSANPDIRNSQIYNITETPVIMSMFSYPTFENNTALNVGQMALGIVPETYSVDAAVPIRDFAGYENITYYLYATQYYSTITRQTVNSGTTITIPAGVVFKGGMGILVNGKIRVEGDPGNLEGGTPQPVVFTDAADDAYGNPGDSNGDGSGSQPGLSNYARLVFADISDDSSDVRYATFRYATVGVQLQQASPNIFNCRFDNDTWGIELNGVSTPAVNGCRFNNLTYAPLHTSLVSYPRSTMNNTISGSTYRAIGILEETLVQDVLLLRRSFAGINNIPYVLGNYTIGTGATLTIQPGVILKFMTQASLTVNKGLIAEGGSTNDSTIVFTDIKDDFYGGDTNADTSASEPCADCWPGNEWLGIVFNDESLDPLCRLKHCIIRYTGDYWGGSFGVRTNNASPTVTYSSINHNKVGMAFYGASDPVVNNCDISHNLQFGINNVNQSFTIDARNNWWGSNSGPTHSGNPGGVGDIVTDAVDYNPFLTSGSSEPVAGDVSLNGSVQAYDASLILQNVVDPVGVPFSPDQQRVADVSGAAGITAYDASLILQYVVGAIQYFPIETRPGMAPFVAPKLSVASVEIGGGSTVRSSSLVVPISAKDLRNLASVDIRLTYDPKLLTPREIKASQAASGATMLTKFANGRITIAMASAKYFDLDGDLLYVTFDVAADVRGTVNSPVSCTRLLLNEKDYTSSAAAGRISIVGKPVDFALAQNYPNPFNPSTTINYQIPEDGTHVRIAVYNALGETVCTLVDQDVAAGSYQKAWDGRTDLGIQAGSGIYFYRLTATGLKNFTSVKKMLLMR